MIDHCRNAHVQDALSPRCMPQLREAAGKILLDVRRTLEIGINSYCDNPIIWSEPDEEDVISACNPDPSYVGIGMDSVCIAATYLAKTLKCRNDRTIDETLSGGPWFLVENPGLNSGLMIPQCTQVGLLGGMRMFSTPSTIGNTPTYGNQEDYMAMGYNAAKKSVQTVEKLGYILAIELLSTYEPRVFFGPSLARSPVATKVLAEIDQRVPTIEQDISLYPHIEFLQDFVHPGGSAEIVEQTTGRSLL